MTYTITEHCIGCSRCLSACPTGAVQQEGNRYWIEPNLCTGCVGYYTVPQCAAACPTNQGCLPVNSALFQEALPSLQTSIDYWEWWFATYDRLVSRLHGAKQSTYWEQWFDRYAKELSHVLQTQTTIAMS